MKPSQHKQCVRQYNQQMLCTSCNSIACRICAPFTTHPNIACYTGLAQQGHACGNNALSKLVAANLRTYARPGDALDMDTVVQTAHIYDPDMHSYCQ